MSKAVWLMVIIILLSLSVLIGLQNHRGASNQMVSLQEIIVQPRENLLKLIEGRPFRLPLRLKPEYLDENIQLTYTIKPAPTGMRLENRYGVSLVWDNPRQVAVEGSIPVALEISDDERSELMVLQLTVTAGRLLETRIEDRVVTISDNNSTLKGLRFEFLTEEGNPQDLKIYKMDSSKLPTVHSAYPPGTELFYISPKIEGSIKVEMPVEMFSQAVSLRTHSFLMMNWIDRNVFDREAGFWVYEDLASDVHFDSQSNEIVGFDPIKVFGGLYYIAITKREIPLSSNEKKNSLDVMVKMGAEGASGAGGTIGVTGIDCQPRNVGVSTSSDGCMTEESEVSKLKVFLFA